MTTRQKKTLFFSLLSVIAVFLLVLLWGHRVQAMESVQQVLSPSYSDATIRKTWSGMLSFVNTIMVVLLLVVAFTNILHVQIDNYSVKKILPSLVIAIILANFSYFICRMFVDVANMILVAVINGPASGTVGGDTTNQAGQLGIAKMVRPLIETPEGKKSIFDATAYSIKPGPAFWGNAWSFLVVQLGKLVLSVFVALISYLFFLRNWIIYFLVVLSPLGFIAMAIPQGKTVFNAWWKNFIQWVFMPVVSAFWLWVGANFLSSTIASTAGPVMMFVFAIACFYFALTTPFKMGGAIAQGWSNLGKRAWSSTGGAAGKFAKNRWVNPVIDDYKARIQQWYQRTGSVDKDNPNRNFITKAIGWQARRARFIKNKRAERARGVETSSDQLNREAHGGKYGQFLGAKVQVELRDKEGKVVMENGKPVMVDSGLDKKQLAFARMKDNNNSEVGEADWINKFLMMNYYKTGEGQVSLERSQQYADRVKGTENEDKTMRMHIQALANDLRKGIENAHMDNVDQTYLRLHPESGGLHFREMAQYRRATDAALTYAERTGGKRLTDADNENKTETHDLHQIISAKKKTLKDLETIGQWIAGAEGEEREQLVKYRDDIKAHMRKLEGDFNRQVGLLKNRYYSDDKGWETNAGDLGRMLGNRLEHAEFNNTTDPGKNALSFHEVNHVPEAEWGLYDTRVRKEFSTILAKEKMASVGKREGPEAYEKFELLGQEGNALKNFFARDFNGIRGDLVRQMWGEYANAISQQGSLGSAMYSLIQGKVTDGLAAAGADDFDKGKLARKDLAERLRWALQQGGNNAAVKTQAERETFGDDATKHIKDTQPTLKEDTKEFRDAVTAKISELAQDPAQREQLGQKAVEISLRHFKVNQTDIDKAKAMYDITLNEHNQLEIENRDWGNASGTTWKDNTGTASVIVKTFLANANVRERNLSDTLRGLDMGVRQTNITGKEGGNYVTNQTNLPPRPRRAGEAAPVETD